jgi:hypothetical protein
MKALDERKTVICEFYDQKFEKINVELEEEKQKTGDS